MMRRLLDLLALYLFVCALLFAALQCFERVPARAQMTMVGVENGRSSGGGSPALTIGNFSFVSNGNSPGTVTVTNLNGGVNWPSGARVYMLLFLPDTVAPPTPLLGGQTPTLIAGASDSLASPSFFWYFATMPSAQADTFSFTNGGAYNKVAAAAVYMTGVTATPTASSASAGGYGCCSGTQQPAASITVPATGFGIAGLAVGCGFGGITTQTWTSVVTAGGDLNGFGGGCVLSIAHTATAGAGWRPGVTGSSSFDFIAGVGSFAVGP